MDSFRGCLFCMSVCIMYVCRIYILDVCVFDDCVAVVGVRHLCVFNAQIWNVCLQNVCDQCVFGEWLCGFNSDILFVMESFVLDASVRDLRMLNGWDEFVSPGFLRWMNVYWITVWRMSECWMTKFRMFDCYVFVMGSCRGCLFCRFVCLMPKFDMSVCRMSVINVCFGNDCVALISFLWWDLLSPMPLCGISVCWMAEISLCVSKISALDECLLDNCLKNVRVLNA